MRHSFTRTFATVGTVLAASNACFAAAAPGELTPETEVRVHVIDRVRSGSSRVGDRIDFRVDNDVKDVAGNVLIRAGTPAYGTVTKSRGAGAWGKRGLLDIAIEYTTAVDGQRVPLRGSGNAGGRKGGTAAWATAAIVAPLAGFFVKGGNVTIEAGASMIAFVDSTLTVGAAQVAQPVPAFASPAQPVQFAASQHPEGTRGPAQSILLKNGDRITGSVEGLAGGVYTIVTANGTLKIAQASVREIKELGAAPAPVRTVKNAR